MPVECLSGAARVVCAVVIVSGLMAPGWVTEAHAQAGAGRSATAAEKAAAEALFDTGLALMRDGNYAEACQKLEQSQRIEPGIGTQLYLAECFAKVGRTASAWAMFREAASAAAAQGQAARAEAGRQRAQELEAELSYLTVQVAEGNRDVDGIRVLLGPLALSPQTWGVRLPVDPGTREVRAEAPGYEPFATQVTVPAQGGNVAVAIPALVKTKEPEPMAAPPSAETTAGQASATPRTGVEVTASPVPPSEGLSGQQVAGLAVGGAGLVALAVGTYFGIDAMDKAGEAEDLGCGDAFCPTEAGLAFTDDADKAATLSNVFVGGGLVLVASGAILYLLEPFGGESEAATQVSLHPAFSLDGREAGLSLEGAF